MVESCNITVMATERTTAYYKALINEEYMISDIAEGETLKIEKKFGEVWYETEINGRSSYIMADKFCTVE